MPCQGCMSMLLVACLSWACCVSMHIHAFQCYMSLLHVHAVCSYCRSTLLVYAASHAADQCCISCFMSLLRIHAECLCCMPLLHFHHIHAFPFCLSMHVNPACSVCISTLHFHAACPSYMYMLLANASHPWCMSMPNVHALCPGCMSLLVSLIYVCLCCKPMLHVPALKRKIRRKMEPTIWSEKKNLWVKWRENKWFVCFTKRTKRKRNGSRSSSKRKIIWTPYSVLLREGPCFRLYRVLWIIFGPDHSVMATCCYTKPFSGVFSACTSLFLVGQWRPVWIPISCTGYWTYARWWPVSTLILGGVREG
jgi:hypothetical protein